MDGENASTRRIVGRTRVNYVAPDGFLFLISVLIGQGSQIMMQVNETFPFEHLEDDALDLIIERIRAVLHRAQALKKKRVAAQNS